MADAAAASSAEQDPRIAKRDSALNGQLDSLSECLLQLSLGAVLGSHLTVSLAPFVFLLAPPPHPFVFTPTSDSDNVHLQEELKELKRQHDDKMKEQETSSRDKMLELTGQLQCKEGR